MMHEVGRVRARERERERERREREERARGEERARERRGEERRGEKRREEKRRVERERDKERERETLLCLRRLGLFLDPLSSSGGCLHGRVFAIKAQDSLLYVLGLILRASQTWLHPAEIKSLRQKKQHSGDHRRASYLALHVSKRKTFLFLICQKISEVVVLLARPPLGIWKICETSMGSMRPCEERLSYDASHPLTRNTRLVFSQTFLQIENHEQISWNVKIVVGNGATEGREAVPGLITEMRLPLQCEKTDQKTTKITSRWSEHFTTACPHRGTETVKGTPLRVMEGELREKAATQAWRHLQSSYGTDLPQPTQMWGRLQAASVHVFSWKAERILGAPPGI